MTTDFVIKLTSWQDDETALRTIRTTVYIEEQHVPIELEWDGLDEAALHWLAFDQANNPVGTARLLDNGHIGRMAVLKPHRNKGVGSALLAAVLNEAAYRGMPRLFLNAQVTAVPFYERFGFKAEGDVFDDAGIPHLRMSKSS